MRCLIVLVIMISLFFGCGVSKEEHEKLKNDLAKIKIENQNFISENQTLKKQLDEINYGAGRLLIKAKNYYDQQNYKNASDTLAIIINKHPQSSEIKEGKELLAKIDKILKAQIEDEKKKLANATDKLIKSYDKIEKVNWYHDKYTQASYQSRIYLYMGITDSSLPWLRLVIRYYGDDWLFVQKYIIQVDGVNYYIIPETLKRDVGSGSVWETLDMKIDSNTKNIIKAIINSKTATLRFEGEKSVKDHEISKNEKIGIQDILYGYNALGGGKF